MKRSPEIQTASGSLVSLDEDGVESKKAFRGFRLQVGTKTWFYAGSRHWTRKKDQMMTTGGGHYLGLAPDKGVRVEQVELDCPEILFGVEGWKLVTVQDWKRLLPFMEAAGWPSAGELGLSHDGVIWVRDKPGKLLSVRSATLSPAKPGATAGRVFCAPGP